MSSPQPGRVHSTSGFAATLRAALRRLTLIEAAEYTAALAVLVLWLAIALEITP